MWPSAEYHRYTNVTHPQAHACTHMYAHAQNIHTAHVNTHRLVRVMWRPWALYHETTVHTLLSMCACVHTHVHTCIQCTFSLSQISMFQLLLVDNQLMLSNLHNYNCSSVGGVTPPPSPLSPLSFLLSPFSLSPLSLSSPLLSSPLLSSPLLSSPLLSSPLLSSPLLSSPLLSSPLLSSPLLSSPLLSSPHSPFSPLSSPLPFSTLLKTNNNLVFTQHHSSDKQYKARRPDNQAVWQHNICLLQRYNIIIYVTYFSSQGGTLIDFQSSNREVWGVWRRREGGGQEKETLVQRAVYDR